MRADTANHRRLVVCFCLSQIQSQYPLQTTEPIISLLTKHGHLIPSKEIDDSLSEIQAEGT